MRSDLTDRYRPLFFLSALGAGGLAVSFFTYAMFLVPHPRTPVPTYADVAAALGRDDALGRVLLPLALLAMTALVLLHVRLLVVNVRAHRRFVRTPAYQDLRGSNAEVTLMALPLTAAMSVNVAFVSAVLAVPGLWDVVEYLFPVALVALTAVGLWGMALFGRYLRRILGHSGFDIDDTNHFAQVLPSFAFAMVAVGFASPGAMSSTPATSVLGILGTFVFGVAAVLWAAVKLAVSFGMMLRKGMAVEAGPTLWIGIPILTLFGIMFVRVGSGTMRTLLGEELSPVLAFLVLGLVLAAELVLGVFGWAVMSRQGYFREYVTGPGRSAGSFGLICPGVAFSVLLMFFVHWGLVRNGLAERFDPVHVALLAVVLTVQVATGALMLRLNGKLIGRASAVPA
jgi:hypothetical protein